MIIDPISLGIGAVSGAVVSSIFYSLTPKQQPSNALVKGRINQRVQLLEDQLKRLEDLPELLTELDYTGDPDAYYKSVCKLLSGKFRADHVAILQPNIDRYSVTCSEGFSQSTVENLSISFKDPLIQYLARNRRAINLNGKQLDAFRKQSTEKLNHAILAPMYKKDKIQGFIWMSTSEAVSPWDEGDLDIASILSVPPTILSIQSDPASQKRVKALQAFSFMMKQIEESLQFLEGQSSQIELLGTELAQSLRLTHIQHENIKQAAQILNIGYYRQQLEILNARRELNPTERQKISHHPEYGANLIAQSEDLSHLAPILLAHHERLDGSGYPSQLMGGSIPVESQILGLVEVYTSLVSERPYRAAYSREQAFDILKGELEGKFDNNHVQWLEHITAEKKTDSTSVHAQHNLPNSIEI